MLLRNLVYGFYVTIVFTNNLFLKLGYNFYFLYQIFFSALYFVAEIPYFFLPFLLQEFVLQTNLIIISNTFLQRVLHLLVLIIRCLNIVIVFVIQNLQLRQLILHMFFSFLQNNFCIIQLLLQVNIFFLFLVSFLLKKND